MHKLVPENWRHVLQVGMILNLNRQNNIFLPVLELIRPEYRETELKVVLPQAQGPTLIRRNFHVWICRTLYF